MSIHDANGERWIPAKQVGEALGNARLTNLIGSLAESGELVKEKHFCTVNVHQVGDIQSRNITVLSYRGVIRCAMRSEGKRAKEFRDWAEDVLYSVMTTGGYKTETESQIDPVRLSENVERFAKMARRMGMQKNHIPQFINSMIVSSDGIDLFAIAGMKPGDAASAPDSDTEIPPQNSQCRYEIPADNELFAPLVRAWWAKNHGQAMYTKELLDLAQARGIDLNLPGKKNIAKTACMGKKLIRLWSGCEEFTVSTAAGAWDNVAIIRSGLRCNAAIWRLKLVREMTGQVIHRTKAVPETLDPADAAATSDWTDEDLLKNGAFSKSEIPMARRLLHHAIKWCAAKGIKQVPDPAEKAHLN